MDQLKDFYRCKELIEFELKQVAQSINSHPKRFRSEPDSKLKNKKFESSLLRLKARWSQSIDAIFNSIYDTGVYDKLAHDLAKSFHILHKKYKFDSDQLEFAFRCTIIPVSSQIIEDSELGKRAYERQERRKYFLLKILTYSNEDKQIIRARQETPSVDGSVDVCSDNPRTRDSNEPDIGSNDESEPSHLTIYTRPTHITINIVDILVDALCKFTKSVTGDSTSGRDRIYHMMNIFHIVDLTKRYLNDIRSQIEDGNHYGDDLNLDLLEVSFEKFKTKLWNALELIDVANPQTVFRCQLDLLLMQFTSLKAIIRR
jgi:hypothetical protein